MTSDSTDHHTSAPPLGIPFMRDALRQAEANGLKYRNCGDRREFLMTSATDNKALPVWRRQTIEWMYEVGKAFHFDYDTISSSVFLFDRVISMSNVPSTSIQIASLVCLVLASKLHERWHLRDEELRDFSAIATWEQLQLTEISILTALNWDLNTFTPLAYARTILAILDNMVQNPKVFHPMRIIFERLSYYCNLDFQLSTIPTEILGSAFVYVACRVRNLSFDDIRTRLEAEDVYLRVHDGVFETLSKVYESNCPVASSAPAFLPVSLCETKDLTRSPLQSECTDGQGRQNSSRVSDVLAAQDSKTQDLPQSFTSSNEVTALPASLPAHSAVDNLPSLCTAASLSVEELRVSRNAQGSHHECTKGETETDPSSKELTTEEVPIHEETNVLNSNSVLPEGGSQSASRLEDIQGSPCLELEVTLAPTASEASLHTFVEVEMEAAATPFLGLTLVTPEPDEVCAQSTLSPSSEGVVPFGPEGSPNNQGSPFHPRKRAILIAGVYRSNSTPASPTRYQSFQPQPKRVLMEKKSSLRKVHSSHLLSESQLSETSGTKRPYYALSDPQLSHVSELHPDVHQTYPHPHSHPHAHRHRQYRHHRLPHMAPPFMSIHHTTAAMHPAFGLHSRSGGLESGARSALQAYAPETRYSYLDTTEGYPAERCAEKYSRHSGSSNCDFSESISEHYQRSLGIQRGAHQGMPHLPESRPFMAPSNIYSHQPMKSRKDTDFGSYMYSPDLLDSQLSQQSELTIPCHEAHSFDSLNGEFSDNSDFGVFGESYMGTYVAGNAQRNSTALH